MTDQVPPPPPPETIANGAAWAALLSAGIGGAVFGALTDLSEASATASRYLQWYRPAGSLSGVGIGTTVVWAGVWSLLHVRWSGTNVRHQKLLLVTTGFLAAIGLVATFPPFYELL